MNKYLLSFHLVGVKHEKKHRKWYQFWKPKYILLEKEDREIVSLFIRSDTMPDLNIVTIESNTRYGQFLQIEETDIETKYIAL